MTRIKNIYLPEDDQDDVFFFRYALQKIHPDYKLTVASDGHNLLEKLQSAPARPDLIFMDINMPVLNGLEALERLKTMPSLRATPIIVYSTSKNDTDILKAYKNGASSYLVKPLDIGSLEVLIAKVLSLDWKHYPKQKELCDFVLSL